MLLTFHTILFNNPKSHLKNCSNSLFLPSELSAMGQLVMEMTQDCEIRQLLLEHPLIGEVVDLQVLRTLADGASVTRCGQRKPAKLFPFIRLQVNGVPSPEQRVTFLSGRAFLHGCKYSEKKAPAHFCIGAVYMGLGLLGFT